MELEIECEFFFSMLSLCLKLMLIDPPPGLAWWYWLRKYHKLPLNLQLYVKAPPTPPSNLTAV